MCCVFTIVCPEFDFKFSYEISDYSVGTSDHVFTNRCLTSGVYLN